MIEKESAVVHARARAALAALWMAALAVLAGCTPHAAHPTGTVVEAPPKAAPSRRAGVARPNPYMTVEEVERAPLESDIVEVHAHYNLFPWLQFDPTDPRPQGFVISALFLVTSRTNPPRGVFADGLITVKMYRVDRDPQHHEVRTLAQTWTFTPEQALPYRAMRRTVVGEGYSLRLRWSKDLDLVNREIVVLVEFTRRDGKIISGSPKALRVPRKVNG